MALDNIFDAHYCAVMEDIFQDLTISRDSGDTSGNSISGDKEFDGANDEDKEGPQEGKQARKKRR